VEPPPREARVSYEVRHGRVQTWSLEAQAVDHCNLRCAQCCQLAPHLKERCLEPEVLARDLERAATVLEPQVFKLTGGEPLLHPEIVRLLEVVKASGIAPTVQVTSNGLLLAKMPDAFFSSVDRLKVSWYTSAPLSESALARIEARCREHEVELAVRAYDAFQDLTPEPLFLSDGEAKRSYAGCWLKSRCHTLHRGRFYACSRPPRLEPYLRARGHANHLAEEDGVDLDSPRLLALEQFEHPRERSVASAPPAPPRRGPRLRLTLRLRRAYARRSLP
jgi:hypothetical protein